MEKSFKVAIPTVPNFLKVNTNTLSIAEFTEKELREIGKEWTEALVTRANEIRLEA